MFRKIMVPTDGSQTSNLALEEAIKLAKDQKASLYLFHAVDELSLVANSAALDGGMYIGRMLEDFVAAGKKILAAADAKVRKHGLRSTSLLIENLTSPTSDLIIKQAKKWHADVIVMGTHGRRGVRRLVMGSDAEGVVRTTPVPVLLVRSTARAPRRVRSRARKK